MPDIVRRNFRQYDRSQGHDGIVAPTMELSSNGTLALTSNTGYFARFFTTRPMTIVSISYVVTTGAANDDPVDVGIFSAALARLGSSGATTGKLNGAAGVKNVPLSASVSLTAGTVYYAGFAPGTFTGAVATVIGNSNASSHNADLFGTAVPAKRIFFQSAVAHPLTNPAVNNGATTSVPIMALREA